jgi:hypothetical protein
LPQPLGLGGPTRLDRDTASPPDKSAEAGDGDPREWPPSHHPPWEPLGASCSRRERNDQQRPLEPGILWRFHPRLPTHRLRVCPSGSVERRLECSTLLQYGEAAADVPVVEAAHIPWRPLGRLLVAKGLLTEEQLENALHDQALTGRRLGEILVQLDFISQQTLSLALAEQYGIDPPAETGFGTGLLAAIEFRQGPDGNPEPETDRQGSEPVPALRLVPDRATLDSSPEDPDSAREAAVDRPPLAGLEEQWAKLAAAEERLAETERELASLTRTNERRRRQVGRLIERVRQRERRIADLSARTGELPRVAATTKSAPDTSTVQSHLVLAQLGQRYQLIERDGPPPEADTVLELPEISEARFLVVGVGHTPLPNDPRRCVLAQQLRMLHD